MGLQIFEQEILVSGSNCYFIAASAEKPHIYHRFLGEIVSFKIAKDSVTYFVRCLGILESKEWINLWMHRASFRVVNSKTKRRQLKRLDCYDLTLNWPSFQRTFPERYKTWEWIVSSVHVTTNADECDGMLTRTVEIMSSHLATVSEELEKRKV